MRTNSPGRKPEPCSFDRREEGNQILKEEGARVSLDEFKGKWVVLYFYPRDFTSGCTIEPHQFQRDLEKYAKRNAGIVGITVETVDSHASFCTKESVSFKLLADPNHTVVEKYGSVLLAGA